MTVSVIFSETSAGDSMAETQDSGTVVPGSESDIHDLFIRHDAVAAAITNCAWYITRCVSVGYLGDDADTDITEVLSWGDGGDGFIINQIVPVSWTDGPFAPVGDASWDVFKNGYGDVNAPITLDEDAISTGTPAGNGVIPVDGEAHVQLKWSIPSSVALGSGYRGLSLVFAYSATS